MYSSVVNFQIISRKILHVLSPPKVTDLSRLAILGPTPLSLSRALWPVGGTPPCADRTCAVDWRTYLACTVRVWNELVMVHVKKKKRAMVPLPRTKFQVDLRDVVDKNAELKDMVESFNLSSI